MSIFGGRSSCLPSPGTPPADCALGWRRYCAYQTRSLHLANRLYLSQPRDEAGFGMPVVGGFVSHPHLQRPAVQPPLVRKRFGSRQQDPVRGEISVAGALLAAT